MKHCSESVKAYEKLPLGEQAAFIKNFIKVEPKNSLKALLINCVRLRSWHLLVEALKEPEIREVLWIVIDDLLNLAHSDGTEETLLHSLPSALSEKEGRIALVFPSRIASWSLTEALLAKGALPGKETFTRAFSAYQSRSTTPYEFKLITAAMGQESFGWIEILGFPEMASSSDLVKRSKISSKPAYIACAFALMNDERKAMFFEESYNKGDDLSLLYSHITNEGSWMQYLPTQIKGIILSDDIGI